MPGLRGFSSRNLRNMRMFYEEWSKYSNKQVITPLNLAVATAKIEDNEIGQLQIPNSNTFLTESFLAVGFTQHITILGKIKELDERIYYIKRCAEECYNVERLKKSIEEDDYHHQGIITSNFKSVLSDMSQALRAIGTFKDQYMLDFINVEELDARDVDEVDERVLENAIIHNIKNFIMTFGKDFTFIRNQYHLDAFGEDQYIDLLFFNRALNCLVAVELKTGIFKTAYLGQLQGVFEYIGWL